VAFLVARLAQRRQTMSIRQPGVRVALLEPHPDDAVLFACYTLLRETPYVVTVLCDDEQRIWESKAAMHFLSLQWSDWNQNETNPDWAGIKEAMMGMSVQQSVERVWLPLPEQGGHDHHNRVGEIGRDVFGSRARFYATYRRGEGRTRTDNEVVPQPSWPAAKFKAMGHYISQINHPQMRPWFNDWDREFIA
jgi:hypothetical protein